MTDGPSDVVAQRVKELRRKRGWSLSQLAAGCAEVGAEKLTENVLENIEHGRRDKTGRRRREVSAEELFALARVLDVSVVDLLVPPSEGQQPGDPVVAPEDHAPYQVTPAVTAPRYMVRSFITGDYPLFGMDAWTFFRERPSSERMPDDALARSVRVHRLGRPLESGETLPDHDDAR